MARKQATDKSNAKWIVDSDSDVNSTKRSLSSKVTINSKRSKKQLSESEEEIQHSVSSKQNNNKKRKEHSPDFSRSTYKQKHSNPNKSKGKEKVKSAFKQALKSKKESRNEILKLKRETFIEMTGQSDSEKENSKSISKKNNTSSMKSLQTSENNKLKLKNKLKSTNKITRIKDLPSENESEDELAKTKFSKRKDSTTQKRDQHKPPQTSDERLLSKRTSAKSKSVTVVT